MLEHPLYFPSMNIPKACSAFGTLLLLSEDISIIAPTQAPIYDRFTNEMLETNILRRVDPFRELGREKLDEIRQKVQKAGLRSIQKWESVPFSKLQERIGYSKVHRDKFIPPNFEAANVMRVHRGKIIGDSQRYPLLGPVDKDGFIKMPADQAMLLLGLLAKAISTHKRLPVVASSENLVGVQYENAANNAIMEASVDLLPSVAYGGPHFSIPRLIEARRQFKNDLQDYYSNVAKDLKARIEFSVEGFVGNSAEGKRFLEVEKKRLKEIYSGELAELSQEIRHQVGSEIARVSLGIVLPTIISMALHQDSFHSAAFVGLSGLISTIPRQREISNRISKHKVVYNINKFRF